EGERIHCEDARPAGAQRGKRLLVWVVAVGGEDDERIHAGLLPVAEQVVHPAVQRLAAHRGVAWERAAGGGVDAVFDRRRAQDLEGRRKVVGETLDDERVAAEREVGAVLLAGPHRHEEAGIALENETHLVGDKGLQVERRAHLALAGCAVAVAAGEWLHGNAAAWAWVAGAAALATAVLAFARRPRAVGPGAAALACLALGAVLVGSVRQVWRIECCWTALREERVWAASQQLATTLSRAAAEARRLAERGATAALLPREAAIAQLPAALESGGRAAREGRGGCPPPGGGGFRPAARGAGVGRPGSGRGARGRDSRTGRRADGLGRPPPVPARAGYRRAARRHHSILRVARGPAPDARRRRRRRQRPARRRAGRAGPRARGERAVRARPRRDPALLSGSCRAPRLRRVRLLSGAVRAERYALQRPARAALAGRRETRGAARHRRPRRCGTRRRPGVPLAHHPARPAALARRARRRLVSRARAARPGAPPHRVVLPRGVLSPGVGSAERVGGPPRRPAARGAPR